MMKRIVAGILGAALLTFSVPGQAAEGKALPDYSWSFDGIFGKFDRPALQRGYQVYREVCAGCHAMRLVAFRNLADLGYDTDQIKAFAAEATVIDGSDDEGEMFEREGKPADRFPSPFPNDKEVGEVKHRGRLSDIEVGRFRRICADPAEHDAIGHEDPKDLLMQRPELRGAHRRAVEPGQQHED